MENFNLKQLGLTELTHQEMLEIDGGNFFYNVGRFFGRIVGSMSSVSVSAGPVTATWELQCQHC